ncbi:MAG: 4Fe-4S ferredoxin, iron-sulfur binding, partial [uncultured Nocardioides sp.]
DLRHRPAVRRPQGPRVRRRVSGRLHLRGQAHALHPPRRVCRLRRLRARVPRRGDLLRGRHAGGVEGVLHGQRGLLQRPRLARRRRQDGRDRQGPPDRRRAASPRARGV